MKRTLWLGLAVITTLVLTGCVPPGYRSNFPRYWLEGKTVYYEEPITGEKCHLVVTSPMLVNQQPQSVEERLVDGRKHYTMNLRYAVWVDVERQRRVVVFAHLYYLEGESAPWELEFRGYEQVSYRLVGSWQKRASGS